MRMNGKIPPPPLQPMVLPCLDILKAWQMTQESFVTTTNNVFFNPSIGTLESPTSTLHFSDNVMPLSAISKYNIENPKPFTKENRANINGVVQLCDIVDYPIDASYYEDSLRPAPSFMEGFYDAECAGPNSNNIGFMGSFHGNLEDISSDGGLEDNKKYWNNVLNGETNTAT
ncbi:OLC1v1015845C1 [Oldenlandia corymbosa var. corymbosa]|uniref:OLC1v1015845C1 n=1 Tax=Oldenlandia corymbosa var. corymbosa TaxID=529605 RepID=A0AAV1E430_OLDCO|nr:OLC1v1015845C1 [Oldenlandia corymbosa var. corymbosa]